ncbi:MAG: hypothetical protein MJK04_22670 [Psychrosphaera sp.]|nr:hypothetical protein [Psychrosphaera sp.]
MATKKHQKNQIKRDLRTPPTKRNSHQQQLFEEDEQNKTLTKAGLILIVFGLLCWLMEAIFSGGYKPHNGYLTIKGGLYGPFTVAQAKSDYRISLRQINIAVGHWNAVDIAVLDVNKNTLFSFGDEFWHEKGYDEGNWDESKQSVEMKVQFEKTGDYYLSIDTESNATTPDRRGYTVTVQRLRGSTVAFEWLRLISLVLGVLVLVYRFREAFEEEE